MWKLATPWYDPAVRGIIIYFFIFFLARFMGKKQLAKLSSFDLLLLIVTGQIIQNGLSGEDHSLLSSLITVTTIIFLNVIKHTMIQYLPWLEKFIEGQPVVVILNGRIFKKVMKKQKITESELFEALREHEIMNPEDVKCAILEMDGKISVIKYEH